MNLAIFARKMRYQTDEFRGAFFFRQTLTSSCRKTWGVLSLPIGPIGMAGSWLMLIPARHYRHLEFWGTPHIEKCTEAPIWAWERMIFAGLSKLGAGSTGTSLRLAIWYHLISINPPLDHVWVPARRYIEQLQLNIIFSHPESQESKPIPCSY